MIFIECEYFVSFNLGIVVGFEVIIGELYKCNILKLIKGKRENDIVLFG